MTFSSLQSVPVRQFGPVLRRDASCIGRVLVGLCLTTVCVFSTVGAEPAHAWSISAQQGLVIRDAQYMDKHGYNPAVGKQFVTVCTMLKKYACIGGFDWCTAEELRYVTALRDKPELKQYFAEYFSTTCADASIGRVYTNTRTNMSR